LQKYQIPAFVKAYDSGGTVFEGKSRYKSIDDALQELEVKVKAYLQAMEA